MKVNQKCPICGKEFETTIGINGKLRKTYCSSECYAQYFTKLKNRKNVCVVCGSEFPYENGKGTKTCSKECLRKLKIENLSIKKEDLPKINCLECGKEVSYEKYKQYKPSLIPKFCNKDCYFQYLKVHSKEVLDKTNLKEQSHEYRKCEMCGEMFYVYKKTKKRFCSDECRYKYTKTNDFKLKMHGKNKLSRLMDLSIIARHYEFYNAEKKFFHTIPPETKLFEILIREINNTIHEKYPNSKFVIVVYDDEQKYLQYLDLKEEEKIIDKVAKDNNIQVVYTKNFKIGQDILDGKYTDTNEKAGSPHPVPKVWEDAVPELAKELNL